MMDFNCWFVFSHHSKRLVKNLLVDILSLSTLLIICVFYFFYGSQQRMITICLRYNECLHFYIMSTLLHNSQWYWAKSQRFWIFAAFVWLIISSRDMIVSFLLLWIYRCLTQIFMLCLYSLTTTILLGFDLFS